VEVNGTDLAELFDQEPASVGAQAEWSATAILPLAAGDTLRLVVTSSDPVTFEADEPVWLTIQGVG
jgi:hypothetical protein